VAIWESLNLSNPGASWTTPVRNADGSAVTKPTWEAASAPARIITDPAEVMVAKDVEVKRFRVGVRRSSQGFMLKVSDGGSRRIRRETSTAGKGAYHIFDYSTQEAVVMRPEKMTPLLKWEAEVQS